MSEGLGNLNSFLPCEIFPTLYDNIAVMRVEFHAVALAIELLTRD